MIVKNIFISSPSKILLYDENSILYKYHNNKLYPYSKIFDNIIDLIYTYDFIFARSNEKIYIIKQNAFKMGLIEYFKIYISSSPIVEMSYYKKGKILCIINNTNIIFYSNFSDSDIIEDKKPIYYELKTVKFIKGILIAGFTDHVKLVKYYYSYPETMCDIKTDTENIYNITDIKDNRLVLKNKDCIDYQGNYYKMDIKKYCTDNVLFYRKVNNAYYFYIRYDNFSNLNFSSKLVDLHNYIMTINFYIYKDNKIYFWDKSPIDDDTIICFIINFNANIITKYKDTILIVDTNYTYVFINDIIKINYQICYDTIHNYKKYSINKDISIDIDISSSILEQLIKIVPNIYRLNYNKRFNFHYIKNDIILSQNISSIVFDKLRLELEEVFKNISRNDNYYIIGNLLYKN